MVRSNERFVPLPSKNNETLGKGKEFFTVFGKKYKNVYLYISDGQAMKRYKVRQVIDLLKRDGWILDRTKGDHRQFVHLTKPGTVTVSGQMNDELSQFLLNSIWKQAGWKQQTNESNGKSENLH